MADKFTDLTAFNITGANRANDVLAIVHLADDQSQKITPAEFQTTYIPRLLGTSAALDTTLRQVQDSALVAALAQLYLATNKSAFAGSLSVGQISAPAAIVDALGTGNTDATLGLRVRSLAGSSNIEVHDGGKIILRNGIEFDPFGSFSLKIPSGSAQIGNMFANGYSAASAVQGYLAFKDYNSGQEIARLGDDGTQRQFVVTDNAGFSGLGGAVILGANSTSKGMLPPRMTTAEFEGIGARPKGLNGFSNNDNGVLWYDGTLTIGFRFNSGTGKFQGYESGGAAWVDLN